MKPGEVPFGCIILKQTYLLLLCSIINWFEAETLCFYLWIASYILELLVGKPWWICLEEDDRLCFWAGIELLDAQLCFER